MEEEAAAVGTVTGGEEDEDAGAVSCGIDGGSSAGRSPVVRATRATRLLGFGSVLSCFFLAAVLRLSLQLGRRDANCFVARVTGLPIFCDSLVKKESAGGAAGDGTGGGACACARNNRTSGDSGGVLLDEPWPAELAAGGIG